MYDETLRQMPEAVLHLGDHITDAESLEYALPDVEILRVPGNCDYASVAQSSILTEFAACGCS